MEPNAFTKKKSRSDRAEGRHEGENPPDMRRNHGKWTREGVAMVPKQETVWSTVKRAPVNE